MKIDGRTLTHDTSELIRRWAVRRVKAGESPSSVMKSYGLCRTTVYRWLRAVKRGGEKALRARQHLGPKAKLTPGAEAEGAALDQWQGSPAVWLRLRTVDAADCGGADRAAVGRQAGRDRGGALV